MIILYPDVHLNQAGGEKWLCRCYRLLPGWPELLGTGAGVIRAQWRGPRETPTFPYSGRSVRGTRSRPLQLRQNGFVRWTGLQHAPMVGDLQPPRPAPLQAAKICSALKIKSAGLSRKPE